MPDPLATQLRRLHASHLPEYLKVMIAPIILIGEGRISYKRAIEIALPQIFQMLAHPNKTIKALHAAYGTARH